MNNPLVSVIVPCYNQAQYLDECLQSVLDQTYHNWECIIVNDGSPDNTEEVAQKWVNKDTRFKYIYKENGGLSSARNAGIEIANSEFILPLDADDKIGFTLIEKIVSGFNDSNDVQIVYCSVRFFGIKEGSYKLPNYSYEKILIQNCFVACSAFRKSDWINVGGYDETFKSFEDWDFWIRILTPKSKVFKIEEELFYYRKHEKGSLTNNFKVDNDFYFNLYDLVYNKNKKKYDVQFGNPILAFQENIDLRCFNEKVKKIWLFKIYVKIKKLL